MTRGLVLSLFPGIGLLDKAFEEEGFTVVRGPDLLWGGDVRRFHPPPDKFDGIIGGPPCQAFSSLTNLVRACGRRVAANLIPEFERCALEAQPRWVLMENVPKAPAPVVAGYSFGSFLLDNRWLGQDQSRRRRISFGMRGEHAPHLEHRIQLAALESSTWAPAVTGSSGMRRNPIKLGGSGKPRRTLRLGRIPWEEACRLQGLPPDFLAAAPFTRWGKELVLGNGVPLPMGRALARAVAAAIAPAEEGAA